MMLDGAILMSSSWVTAVTGVGVSMPGESAMREPVICTSSRASAADTTRGAASASATAAATPPAALNP
jgi:hypothetical protein